MAKRPCIDCSTPTPDARCPRCRQAHDARRWQAKAHTYDTEWRKLSRRTRAAWVDAHGWICPGWDRGTHPSTDLVVDHDVGVLCRGCNATKAATHDKQRAAERR